jgi:hypothetical protein
MQRKYVIEPESGERVHALLVGEFVLLRLEATGPGLKLLSVVDLLYGIFALLLVASGLMRVLPRPAVHGASERRAKSGWEVETPCNLQGVIFTRQERFAPDGTSHVANFLQSKEHEAG